MMAIRILLDHDVLEENIILLSLLMAETGVHSLAYAFPKVLSQFSKVSKFVNLGPARHHGRGCPFK
jgi:uridine kinase